MLSKSLISTVRSLHQKKFREEERLFIVEGKKVVHELMSSGYRIKILIGTTDYLDTVDTRQRSGIPELLAATPAEMERISALSTPQEVLAVVSIPEDALDMDRLNGGWTFLLDDIRDPGNMGTILRIAHWFGVGQVVCSLNSVDAYNPKVVQASMGSIFHVPVHYAGLEGLISQMGPDRPPIIAAVLKGEDAFKAKGINRGMVLLGNESTGIRSALLGFADHRLTIPSYELVEGSRPESLNVAISAALLMAAFRSK